jgi:hypothetical protein
MRGDAGQVSFMKIHDLIVLNAELARLLGITLVETIFPDLKSA